MRGGLFQMGLSVSILVSSFSRRSRAWERAGQRKMAC